MNMNIFFYKYLNVKGKLNKRNSFKNQIYKYTHYKPHLLNENTQTKVMTSLASVISLLLSFSLAIFSNAASFKKLPLPGKRSGPEAFAFDSTGKGFYTGVSGGKILRYLPGKGFVDFGYITVSS